MNSKFIFEKLQERDFEESVKKQLFPIIKKNIDRVVFVKGYIDLPDVLYIEEEGAMLNEFPYFISTGCDFTNANHYVEKIGVIYDNSFLEIDEIKEELITFFQNTDKTLYIDVAFEENVLDNEDMWKIYNRMRERKGEAPFQLMLDYYEYPEWYDVKSSDQVEKINRSLKLIRKVKNKENAEKIKEIRKKMDDSLEKGDFENVKELSIELKKVQDALF